MDRVVIGQENFAKTAASKVSLASAQTSLWTTGAHSARSSSLLRGSLPSRSVLSGTRSVLSGRVESRSVLSGSVELTDGEYDDDTISDLSAIPRDSPSSLDETDLSGVPNSSSPRKRRCPRRAGRDPPPRLSLSSGMDTSTEGVTRQAIHRAVAEVLPSTASLPAYQASLEGNTGLASPALASPALGERPPCIGQEASPTVVSPRPSRQLKRVSRAHVDIALRSLVPEEDITSLEDIVTLDPPLHDLHSTVDSDATFFMDAPLNHCAVTRKVTARSNTVSRKIRKFKKQLQGHVTTLAIV